jgi:uncharacterized protein (TIGR03435 family)
VAKDGDELTRELSTRANRPVEDDTGLSGRYDITLRYVVRPMPLPGRPVGEPYHTGPTVQEAVQGQLGLKLESKKGMGKVFVVDHVEKAPAEN